MRALVTGATGFIGSHIVDTLLARKYDVRVLLRRTSSLEWLKDLPVEFVYGDIFSTDALRQAVTGWTTSIIRPVSRKPNRRNLPPGER